MGISVMNNEIVVDEEELDIYASLELKDVLLRTLENEVYAIRLDLSSVKSISTPAAQVILSAGRSFKHLDIIGELKPSLTEDLRNLGIEAAICRRG